MVKITIRYKVLTPVYRMAERLSTPGIGYLPISERNVPPHFGGSGLAALADAGPPHS